MPAFTRFHHDLDDDRSYVVATTRLTVRSPRTALAFFRRLGPITRQMEHADGLVGYGLRAQLHRMTFSTYGVFESRRALGAFIANGAHGEAMVALGGRLRHVDMRTLTMGGADIPRSWRRITLLLRPEVTPPARLGADDLSWRDNHSA